MGESVKKEGGTKEGHRNREMGAGWRGWGETRACGSHTGVWCRVPKSRENLNRAVGSGPGHVQRASLRAGGGPGPEHPSGLWGCTFPVSEHLPLFLSSLSQPTQGILFPANPAAAFGKQRPANHRQLQAERKILSLNQRGHLFSASSSGDIGGNKGTLSNPFRPQILVGFFFFCKESFTNPNRLSVAAWLFHRPDNPLVWKMGCG